MGKIVGVVVSFYLQESSLLYGGSGRTGRRFSVCWNDDDDDSATVISLLMPASYVSLLNKNDLSSSLVLLDMQIVVCISNYT